MGLIFLSVVQLIVAVLLAAVTTYLGAFIFERATRGLDEWEELRKGNAAIGLVLGAIVVAIAIILRPTVSVSVVDWDLGRLYPYYALLTEAVQILVGLVLAVASISVALYLFSRLTTGIDELEELKKGNLSVAVLLAGVVIAVAFLVTTAIEDIVSRIVSSIF